jgi:sortase A
MRDRRAVDELSIEELERILAIRKREQRMQRLERMRQSGRIVDTPDAPAGNGHVEIESTRVEQPKPQRPAPPAAETDAAPRFEDDGEERPDDPARIVRRKQAWNRTLLGVEIAAVLGLVFIGANMALSIGKLERETQAAQEAANQSRLAGIPTMAPTSVLTVRIEDYVLPGGHVIDEADPSRVSFNLDEFIEAVPAHLQVAVQQQAMGFNIVRPPQTPETAKILSVPRLGIEQSIIQGTDWEALRAGVGQVLNGAYPGADFGNVVFAAHNDIYAQLFRDLDQMQVGDEFYVLTDTKTYTYRVTGFDIVDPTDVYVMENQGRATVTLISCYPFRVNDKRYVVFADRVDPGSA